MGDDILLNILSAIPLFLGVTALFSSKSPETRCDMAFCDCLLLFACCLLLLLVAIVINNKTRYATAFI